MVLDHIVSSSRSVSAAEIYIEYPGHRRQQGRPIKTQHNFQVLVVDESRCSPHPCRFPETGCTIPLSPSSLSSEYQDRVGHK